MKYSNDGTRAHSKKKKKKKKKYNICLNFLIKFDQIYDKVFIF